MSAYSDIQVLVIDDDELVLELVVEIVKDMGVRKVRQADNVVSALEKFADKDNAIQLIICDWIMPGMSGLEFLTHVRKVNNSMPFLMLTSKSNEADVMEAKKLNVTHYVAKPFNIETLQAKLKSVFDEIVTDLA